MNKKVIVLVHGLKRLDEDDFGRVRHFIDEYQDDGYDIINVVWSENMDKKTLKRKFMFERVREAANQINENKYEDINIISYSTGGVVMMYLKDLLHRKEEVKIFAVAPAMKVHKFKWIAWTWEKLKYQRMIMKKLGTKRYLRIEKLLIKEGRIERNLFRVVFYVYFRIIRKDGKRVREVENGNFLLLVDDQFINTPYVSKKLPKTNDIEFTHIRHDRILKEDQEVFIEWFKRKFENTHEEE